MAYRYPNTSGTLLQDTPACGKRGADERPDFNWDRQAVASDVHQFPVFELVLKKSGRIWRWSVCTSEGAVVMEGSESSRPAAKYKAARALFLLLLSAPYQSIRMSRADDGDVAYLALNGPTFPVWRCPLFGEDRKWHFGVVRTVFGTKRTRSRRSPRSVVEGRPEVSGARSERRF